MTQAHAGSVDESIVSLAFIHVLVVLLSISLATFFFFFHLGAEEIKYRRVGIAVYPPWKSDPLERTEVLSQGFGGFHV
jgi:hypothetical protein